MNQIIYNIPHQENFSREESLLLKGKIKTERKLQEDIDFKSYYRMEKFIVLEGISTPLYRTFNLCRLWRQIKLQRAGRT